VAEQERGAGSTSWLRAWLVVGLAAWTQVGVILVARANNEGLVEDISFSPYHVIGYAALLTLAGYVAWTFFRALRRGAWRRAFPPLYGGLGIAFLLFVGWVVLDPIWRDTLGIRDGIENGLAPTRLLIPVGLVLLAVGPLREAIAARLRPGLSDGEIRGRWAGIAAAGLIGSAATLTVFNPIQQPLGDLRENPGIDATEIWTMAPDGSSQTRLLAALGDGVDYSLPAWSPDGNRIAFATWTNDAGTRQSLRHQEQIAAIWTMAADGSDRRLVIEEAGTHLWVPAWSPDGLWIAYTRSPVGPQPATASEPQANPAPGAVGPPTTSAGASIWVVRTDGSMATRLTPEGADGIGATWRSSGTEIAYSAAGAGGGSDIHVASINVGAPGVQPAGPPELRDDHVIAADPSNDWGPAWAPDGDRLVFTSDRSGNEEIWRVEVGGSERTLTQLTDDGAGDWVPAFSPDGSRIAFVSDRSGEPEVWSMAADGSDVRNLTNHPQHYDGQWSVAWAPDGARIAYATGSFGDASGSGWVREDLAAAQAILFGIALSIVALLIVAMGAPLGSFTVALTIIVALSALATDAWRFLPGAFLAGLVVDGLVRSVRQRWRARVAAAALPALANLALGVTIGLTGTLAWSVSLLLGVTIVSAALGWALAEAVERLLPRQATPDEAASG
jgi:Tol biopolymer transport system component